MLDKMHVLRLKRAIPQAISAFHTEECVNSLSRDGGGAYPWRSVMCVANPLRFHASMDPAFEGLVGYRSISPGGSITADQRLTSGRTDICIAINWAGLAGCTTRRPLSASRVLVNG
ncbi:hypothetical protein C8F01DRAFT_1275958 [Mycena amicta]|nr:hypothetical protein C8F01DRAFT_1275958 [Mycena amicta]